MYEDQQKDTSTVSSGVAKWVKEIDAYERKFSSFEKRGKQIIRRYRDKREDVSLSSARFNILWSNVQTLHPAIYANPPTPNIDRRFQDDDDLGRYSALVLERAVSYYVKDDTFDKIMKQTTLDRLLPGRGTVWVRYCPVFSEPTQVTDDAQDEVEEETATLLNEDVVVDYVHWTDFGHTAFARTWQEVDAVWRRVYMGRKELKKRFGDEVGAAVPLDGKVPDKNSIGDSTVGTKAVVYEIWCKSSGKAYWVNKSYPEILDEVEDPLGLKDFFPCPEPLYATLVNDDLVATADFLLYQDQAAELDYTTARISAIIKAVRVAGVYDAAAEGIDRLLSEGTDNKLIPVQQWAALGGGKGMDGVISFFPLDQIVGTLKSLFEARDRIKQDLYEITGISDIVRGATNASETATAQQIKGQFATLRLDNQQKDVARFSRDLVRLMTEVIAKHFDMETIKQVSAIKLLTEQEKQGILQQQQMQQEQDAVAQQQGLPAPEPQPIPENIEELMEMPSWEQVESIIRDDTARSFRIDIETDSTIKTDQENEKQSRIEFLGAVSQFMQQAISVPPELRNLSMELLMFGVRGFKVSRELETSFESAMDKIRKAEKNPQPQPPSPEEQKAQAEQQRTQAEMQIQQMQSQAKMQEIQAKMQADQLKSQTDMQLKQLDVELKRMDIQAKEMELQIKREDNALRAFEASQPKTTEGTVN